MQIAQSRDRVQGAINVTPLVDVVLVLLIIFMVLTPLMQKAHKAELPSAVADGGGRPMPVLRVDHDLALTLGGVPVTRAELPRRLSSLGARPIGFSCDPSVSYQDAMRVMDVARGAGVDRIGIITDPKDVPSR